MLAACPMRFGTCVVGSAVRALTRQEVKAELGIPPELTVVAPIVVGRPCGGTTAPSGRKEPEVLTWK